MSRVGDGALDEFKARLPLVDIVARHVRLIRRGNRHQGLCPFHQEKSPSFYVFEDQGNYHCFGCGVHGNAIDFIMAIEGLPFAEALRRLSDLTGIRAPLRSPGSAETSAERVNPLLAANEVARGWFREQLAASAGRIARDYLQRRGVPEALRQHFTIGYAPDGRDAMVRALEARGIAVATQVQAGLAIEPEDGGRPFDRFRHRLMFPITDQRGRLVGFGGRALGDAKAKYLNTPETPLFKKGSLLYGHDLASKPARERKEIFIVEGYLDVIAMHEAGFPNTVAPLGTAIGEEQLKLLWRYGEEPYVCLDGDTAGLAAALRMIRRALPIMGGGQTLRFVVLPAGEDPDSLLHGRGRAAFEDLLASAVPLSQMIWQAEHNAAPVETPEQIAGLNRRLFDYVRLIADKATQDSFKSYFYNQLFDIRKATLRTRINKKWGGKTHFDRLAGGAGGGTSAAQLAASEKGVGMSADMSLVGMLVIDAELLDEASEDLAGLVFRDPTADRLRYALLDWLSIKDEIHPADLAAWIESNGLTIAADLAVKVFSKTAEKSASLQESVSVSRSDFYSRLSSMKSYNEREAENKLIEEACKKNDFDSIDRIFANIDSLINTRSDH